MKDQGPFHTDPFPEWHDRVRAGFTTRWAGTDSQSGAGHGTLSPYADLNLGFHCGDDPERVRRNWKSLLERSGLDGKPLVVPRMIHGDGMTDADTLPGAEGNGPTLLEPEGADAVCSGSSRFALAVTMADCLTALVFDPACGTVAAVHAGWRGTRARILEKSLRFLADAGRIRPDSALVALGPCLRAESLEVGPEVAAQLPEEFLSRIAGKFHFDMPACNRAQALASGIREENLRDAGGCTLLEPERYFSFRRDGPASGRMAAFISLL